MSPREDSQSLALFERAKKVIVGGVNSPVRAFSAVGGNPPFIARAKGSRIWDVDGNEYIDFVGTWGPAIVGHAHPDVVQAVKDAIENGLSFGAPSAGEVELAELIPEFFPSMEMMRCVSSGTEATMSAIRVARGFTGRDVIVKFEGCYHGHADHLLVKAGSGAATFGEPDSGGVPADIARTTWTLPYNDIPALEALFAEHGAKIATVIVEPVAGNMGCIAPAKGFLEAILEQCKKHGAVSIFDEVMTGFRVSRGGAQGHYGLRPDMTTLGKIVGGGMPMAVYGGRADIMNVVAPLGPVYQAGTLSGNPAAVAAGLATLALLDDAVYTRLESLGARLEAGLNKAASHLPHRVQRVGSMITLFFGDSPVVDFETSSNTSAELFNKFHQGLLARGIYWPPSKFESAFLSTALTDEDINTTIKAATEALA